MNKRLPRKLKKELKKDGVWILMQASIPIVKQFYRYPPRKSLIELLAPVAYKPYKLIG